MKEKKGVLLVNLGTPDAATVGAVRKYLREFLMDGRVIDIPKIQRWLLVNLIIAPFRSPKSTKEYSKLWTDRGSPLKFYGYDLVGELRNQLGDQYVVELGMRYQSPSILSALTALKKQGVVSIKVIPLFPQYASASTGSVQEEVMRIVSGWQVIPKIDFVAQFFNHPLFIETIVDNAKIMMASQQYDHFVFSYHGLPERQIYKAEIAACRLGECCNKCNADNQYCYRAQCFETSRLLAAQLALTPEQYTVAFQSRLGKTPWIKPYTDEILVDLPAT